MFPAFFLDVYNLLYILIGLNVLDGLTTYWALTKISGLEEKNPVLKFLMAKIGIVPTLIIAKAFAPLLMYLLAMNVAALVIVNLIYLIIVINNIVCIKKATQSKS